jgi:hypothetical protein
LKVRHVEQYNFGDRATRQPLSAINEVFDRLEHGKVASRVVLDFAPAETKKPAASKELVAQLV